MSTPRRGGPAVGGRLALVAVVGALVVGLAVPNWAGLVGVVLVLVVGVLVDLLLAGSVRGLRIERPDDGVQVRLGESLAVGLVVTNSGPRRVRGELRDAWPPSCGASPEVAAVDVPVGERRRVTTTLTPGRRGEHAADRVTVRSWGPLGLAARQVSTTAGGRVRVLPAFASRRHLPARLARLRELDGRRATQVRGAGTEFDSLREYVDGDDVRSIDWRASARSTSTSGASGATGNLVVRTWRPERDRHVLVVLDTGRTAAGLVGTGQAAVPRLDAALDAALLLAALASRGGDRVDLLAHDRMPRASVFGARDPLPAMTAALSGVEASLVETDMAALVATVLRRASRRSLVVLLTGLDDAVLADGLEPLLGPLLHRHTLLVAGVADPVVTAMAAERGDAAAVYGAAAGQVALAERRDVAARLSRRGVEVLDAAPDDLAPALADRYLALKARGRL
ncbi:DUF58 domain-containing protein [Actinomycetospora endophytica]|uniref:DUF58 domain-containing protein n=1 Tax=Actinomycetospora endophytica TaxID=2291215 RepID=A0ABS8P9W3_9PSEU|nr:DUF58 domain-containing protein [Actinomycetospora endophytica]MCD2195018.1 DUF58 domain-containing protein [Actinomycetospora endophytica]